jgi:hypothetical protein
VLDVAAEMDSFHCFTQLYLVASIWGTWDSIQVEEDRFLVIGAWSGWRMVDLVQIGGGLTAAHMRKRGGSATEREVA